MQVASWNVNSLRARLDHVLDWLGKNPVDVLCLQETKVKNEEFPYEVFEERNLRVYNHGQPSYNGVAFISKRRMDDIETGFGGVDLQDQARVIAGTLDGVRIINAYCPQGDSLDSPKFELKEAFYGKLADMLDGHNPQEKLLLCGDMNIAPEKRDVHDAEKCAGRVMFTEQEHEWLSRLKDWGLVDSFRLHEDDGGLYSWWDYRAGSWQRNKGWRIDQIWVTEALAKICTAGSIDKEPRGWERPSDHVPIIATFD